jgi:hypothetical protein
MEMSTVSSVQESNSEKKRSYTDYWDFDYPILLNERLTTFLRDVNIGTVDIDAVNTKIEQMSQSYKDGWSVEQVPYVMRIKIQ